MFFGHNPHHKKPGYLGEGPEDKVLRSALKILVRQAARWATAARQDDNPMIAVLHANYGAGYLWAVQDIATPAEVETATGINWKRFKQEILDTQDSAAQRMAKSCPRFAPKKSYLTRIAREG